MSKQEQRVVQTDLDNLIANLRGEVGEVLAAWVMMRRLMAQSARMRSGDISKDIANPDLGFVNMLVDKLRDELVARLSELGDEKVGRLNFHFAAVKLGRFAKDAKAFTQLTVRKRFRAKRNRDISHKELPVKWEQLGAVKIPYRTILRTMAAALRLLKKMDRNVLGPSAPFLWREARKRRYTPMYPPKAAYMLVPYLHLSGEDRVKILVEEEREGMPVWEEMMTTIDGQPTKVLACKRWGIIVLGNRLLPLAQYPLQSISNISVQPPSAQENQEAQADTGSAESDGA